VHSARSIAARSGATFAIAAPYCLCVNPPVRLPNRRRAAVRLVASLCALLLVPRAQRHAAAQLASEHLYIGANRPIVVTVDEVADAEEQLEIRLLEPGTAATVERASVASGRIDLAAMFPVLWTSRAPRLLYAQLFVGDTPRGSALVIQPLMAAPRASDALTTAVMSALKRGDRAAIDQIFSASESWRERLRQTAQLEAEPAPSVLYGLRVYPDREVVIETSAGEMRIRLRPDAAPQTAFHVLSLVEGGFYDGTPFHRIVNADARGRPFIVQTGDPTGLGAGGPGFRLDFEPSSLRHDFGVLSMARLPHEPDSAGSQFFICLSREGCAVLDDQYCAFAEVVQGADTLLMIAATPVGPVNPDNPSSAHERPLDPPVIEHARVSPAPPYGTGPARIVREQAAPIDR
jgi:cyclophilin family peptidyl-prolyl cis-trans isomerase